jgi:hypothetical protein
MTFEVLPTRSGILIWMRLSWLRSKRCLSLHNGYMLALLKADSPDADITLMSFHIMQIRRVSIRTGAVLDIQAHDTKRKLRK